jgi:hypothetical protein
VQQDTDERACELLAVARAEADAQGHPRECDVLGFLSQVRREQVIIEDLARVGHENIGPADGQAAIYRACVPECR